MGDATRGLIYLHGQGMVHGDLKGVDLLYSALLSISDISFIEANILVDETDHACLADFGLLTIISDTSSTPLTRGGTYRWMSPELFYPDDFGLEDSRRTKYSDCYALGMVIYEVLSGQVPFSRYETPAVIAKVGRGERPERPQGTEGKWFTDVIWEILERCWAHKRDDRPGIGDVLRVLEEASKSWTPPPPLTVEDPPVMDPTTWSLSDPTTEERTSEDAVPSPAQAALSRSSQTLPPDGDADGNSIYPPPDRLPIPLHEDVGRQDLGVFAKGPKVSEGSVGALDRVCTRFFRQLLVLT